MRKKLILLTLIFLATSCSFLKNQNQSSEDQPLSIAAPIANLGYIFISAPGLDGNVRITGLDGSVIGGSSITAINNTTNVRVIVTANSSGGFQLEIAAAANHSLTLEVTADGTTNSTSFTVSATDPTPLDVLQTDVAVFQSQGNAYVTASGNNTTNLVAINLSQQQVTNSYLLQDPDTGNPLTDLISIQIFQNARLGLVIDRTQLKFYLVDLDTITVKPTPISIAGNFATIVSQNNLTLRVQTTGESETAIRNAISAGMSTFNSSITTLPDSGTHLDITANVGSTTTTMLVAGTFSGNGLLTNITIENSTLTITSQSALPLPGATLSGLAVFSSWSRALVGNQTDQAGIGNNHLVYVCDLSTMQLLSTLLVDGTPEEMVTSPDENHAYVSLFDTHQLADINTSSLTVAQYLSTGPSPTRVAIGSDGSVATILNTADTTVSILGDL